MSMTIVEVKADGRLRDSRTCSRVQLAAERLLSVCLRQTAKGTDSICRAHDGVRIDSMFGKNTAGCPKIFILATSVI